MARVLVDTNIIIEAVRTECWNALTGRHQVETVQACCDEAEAGDTLATGYIAVAREVTEDVLTDVATQVARAAKPKTYGAAGQLNQTQTATGGIAVNRAL